MPPNPSTLWRCGTVVAILLGAGVAAAQPPVPAPSPPPRTSPPRSADPPDDGGLAVRDTSAGYIDNAQPLDQVFLRTDSGFRFARPNRAEFFYAQARPGGSGLPRPERQVDFTDLTTGAERVLTPRLSVFAGL